VVSSPIGGLISRLAPRIVQERYSEAPDGWAFRYGRDGVRVKQENSDGTTTLFLAGEEAYLPPVSVILIEISEEWATGSAYLALEDGGDGPAPERSVGYLAEGILHRLRAHISHERST